MTADDVFWNRVRGGLMMIVAINQKARAPSIELHSALLMIVRAIEARHPVLVPPRVPAKLPARRVAARRLAARPRNRSDRRDRPVDAKSS